MRHAFLLFILSVLSFFVNAQAVSSAPDTIKAAADVQDSPLVISGTVDTYFKTDFSGHANIPTSFANENNSVSIGMIDLGLKKTVGKASFVGELSFGPRSDQSLPHTDYHIQNLYISYNLTDNFNLSAGYMATFLGYEVTSPAGNFNYSTSYIFTKSPFQNPGLKATFAFSDAMSIMVGIFNNYWNAYSSYRVLPAVQGSGTASGDVSTFGAQLTVNPAKGWTAYLNLLSGSYSGTEVDLTTAYQLTDAFKLGLNAATLSLGRNTPGSFEGIALYPQLAISKIVIFGLRGEYFYVKNGGGHVQAITFSTNIKAGPLTIIPEFRYDCKSDQFAAPFTTSNLVATNYADQFLIAAVYAF